MKTNLKLLFVDSNLDFQKSMKMFADSRGLKLDCFSSVNQMGFIGKLDQYDIAIVECDEGILSGMDVGEYFTSFKINIPLILVSEGRTPQFTEKKSWADSISGFIHKDKGPESILNYALSFVK